MITVSDSIHVDAPVEEVFTFLDDPHNHAQMTPRLTDVRDVERLENGGKRLSYTYRMAGVGLDGELEQTRHEPNERMTFDMRGGIDGEIDLQFAPVEDGGTEFTYTAEYELPGTVLSKAAEPVARRFNERQLKATLRNVAEEFA